MNRYIDTLESMVARQIESDPGSRDAIYERARRAIYETLGALDVEAAREEELRLLDEAIAAVEKKVAAGKIVYEPPPAPEPEPESLRAALRPSLMEPLPPNESPQLRQADTRTPPLPAAKDRLESTMVAPPHSNPAAIAASRDLDVTESTGPTRLHFAGLLLLAAAASALFLLRPELLYSPKTQLPPVSIERAPIFSPVVKLQDLQWSTGGQKGVVSWTLEADRSSFAPKRRERTAIAGRADLRPLAPPVTLYFVPSGDDGLRASHFLEMKFDQDESREVAMVEALKLGAGALGGVEPEGVWIRTGPQSFAFVFSNIPKDAVINEALLPQAEEFIVTFRLENGKEQQVTFQTVKLK